MHQRNSPSARPPVSLTSLVGRECEIEEVRTQLGAHRLVTLTGIGGGGKTRIAAELALRRDWQSSDSVAWIELGACTDSALVPQRAATALSLRARDEVVDAIVDALADRDVLVVLDNCEHVVDGCAELAATLLVRCPKLRILATSREPLGIAGERVWPVPPISLDEAVQLFAERAAAADPAFAINANNLGAITDVCARLDGIPLAIELAAARIRVLTPEQIAARLADRFAILTGGVRTSIPRHRTLRAAIDWSYALLSAREQMLLARLSVFAGSFSLEAAEAVCEIDLDALTGLVARSLVATNSRRASVRYALLETIRQYAAERLEAMNETASMARRHAVAYRDLACEAAIDPMNGILPRLDALDLEHDNIRAALAWSIEHEPDAIALPLAAAFRWYWYYRIVWGEGLRWTTRVLERASPAASADRARVLTAAGTFASYTGDLAAGRQSLEEAEAMWRELGDERELALALAPLAQLLANAGELDAASDRAAESVALARAAGTSYDVGYCLTNAIAFVAQRRGDLESADRALEEAEAIWAPAKHPLGVPFVATTRALVALRRGDANAAARFARSALREAREVWFTARAFRVLAFTSRQDPPRAARLLGIADTLLRKIGARVLPHERNEYDALMTALRESLPSAELEALLREGGEMSIEEACAYAGVDDDDAPAAASDILHVRDLGPLQITLGGKPLVAERASNRARELLVFLLAHPHGRTKEEVGVAFWPDATTEQVKNSFHVTLHRLRKLLGGAESVVADGARYTIAVASVVDSRRFENELTAALRQNDIERLKSALALYAGDFLHGEDAGEWCLPIRAHLRQLQLRGLFALGQALESRGHYTDAAETYTRLLAREPFHEAAARQLMICRARLGARSESLLVYRQLEQRLRDDLQAAPERETSTLYSRLKANETV